MKTMKLTLRSSGMQRVYFDSTYLPTYLPTHLPTNTASHSPPPKKNTFDTAVRTKKNGTNRNIT